MLQHLLKKAHGARVPIWFMRQAGRYLPEYRALRSKFPQFLDLCFHPQAAQEATLQPMQRFPLLSAAIVFSDILIIPHALGQTVRFDDTGPNLSRLDASLLKQMHSVSSELFLERAGALFETIQGVRRLLPLDKGLIGFVGAPWTLAYYMIGRSHVKAFAWSQGALFEALIDLLTERVILFLKEQIRAGVDSVQIFDSWAHILADADWSIYCLKPVQKIIQAIKDEFPNVPVIVFSKVTSFLLQKLPADILSIDTTVPLLYARDNLQPYVALQGNLDPELLVVGGPLLEERVQKILSFLANGPFVFNLGHGILPDTPIDHVASVIHQVVSYERDPIEQAANVSPIS